MSVPQDRRYAQTHEWFKLDGRIVTIGITQFAADELTDVTYVALPSVGKEVQAGTSFGEIESVKATSDLYTAVSGTVREVNTRLDAEPELVNNDPFNAGWMVKVECRDAAPLEKLLDAAAYEKMISK
ncbi:MAG: glycine cleavage system protein GcvH [Phycisphaerae bacterium]|nr:glycine cleavage system protein GcvH [Phycisphaerae bacterium]MCZ2400590.1 glycine cleavage system protein GcvH [Phycisphaerae bacterium]NUQ48688.1 glycine cleavage system protein GcvH [Phycisphaerae bacterium]